MTKRGQKDGSQAGRKAGTAGSPYAYDPYKARDPYSGVPTLGEAVSMKTTRRRNPQRSKKDKR